MEESFCACDYFFTEISGLIFEATLIYKTVLLKCPE